MISPSRITELLAGLTEDQEELLEEILESPYFREDPGVLWRIPCGAHPWSFGDCGRSWTR